MNKSTFEEMKTETEAKKGFNSVLFFSNTKLTYQPAFWDYLLSGGFCFFVFLLLLLLLFELQFKTPLKKGLKLDTMANDNYGY